jgi:hypothetical protein
LTPVEEVTEMPRLSEVVRYRGDRLFDGAVDLSWLVGNREKARDVAAAYVFHGPAYHGVKQQDVGLGSEHKLVDSATFTHQIVRRCAGREEKPFTLAIAGYGTGKSHLATALAILLSEPESPAAKEVLENLKAADPSLGKAVETEISMMSAPALVLALNGMRNFDLATELGQQATQFLRSKNIDTRALDELRPRFRIARSLVERLHEEERKQLCAECGTSTCEEVLKKLEEFDEGLFSTVQAYLSGLGLEIRAIGDETAGDVIRTICQEYVGEGQPFSRLVVLFDEFGRYAEFATIRSQIAGSGVLQQLFEGIQAQSEGAKAVFVGFIQFELNVYVQRIGQEYKNEILRVITRYQTAEKAYLSINLETLMSHLLEKPDRKTLEEYLDQPGQKETSTLFMKRLNNWFPLSTHHRLWVDDGSFHQVIRKGCWPLSPTGVWLLFHLAAGGQFLQQRSALALLKEGFNNNREREFTSFSNVLSATDLWSEALETELLSAEESGSKGAITHSYSNILSKVGQNLSTEELLILRAVVLASKLGLTAKDRQDAQNAIASLAGLDNATAITTIDVLDNDKNVLAWDRQFRQFDITGDTLSRTQFLSILRNRVSQKYGPERKAQLFPRVVSRFFSKVTDAITCDFAGKSRVTTQEWVFAASVTNTVELRDRIKESEKRWAEALLVDEPRGSVIYCYVEPETDIEQLKHRTRKDLQDIAQKRGIGNLPIIVVFLHDTDGTIGQNIAEITVLTEELTDDEKEKFRNLTDNYKNKAVELTTNLLNECLKQRHLVTGMSIEEERESQASLFSSLFRKIYPNILPFPFDGYGTAHGNAAESCYRLTFDLLRGNLTYSDVQAMPPRDRNRAQTVLNDTWKLFLANGEVGRFPGNDSLRKIYDLWEEALKEKPETTSVTELILLACKPPYGGNLASAGLLLGAFLCARKTNLKIMIDGHILEPADLAEEKVFTRRLIDLKKLSNLFLVHSQGGSEWDTFLDDWEAASTQNPRAHVDFLFKERDLRTRVPVPGSQAIRLRMLEEAATRVDSEINELESKIEKIYERFKSMDKSNIYELSFGGIKLKEVLVQIKNKPYLLDRQGILEIKSNYDHVRERVKQEFQGWVADQFPADQSLPAVKVFAERMGRTASNLRGLDLQVLADQVEDQQIQALRKIEMVAKAKSFTDGVKTWIGSLEGNIDLRVVDLRKIKETAGAKIEEAVDLREQTGMAILNEAIGLLKSKIKEADEEEEKIKKEYGEVMEISFQIEKIDFMIQKIDRLIHQFDGLDTDIEYLMEMKQVLQFFKHAEKRFSDENLDEEGMEKELRVLELEGERFSESCPPWMPEEVLPVLAEAARAEKERKGETWIGLMKSEIPDLMEMGASEANNLHKKLENSPLFLTKEQKTRAHEMIMAVEQHLESLELDWLMEKFKALTVDAKKKFLKFVLEMAERFNMEE